MKRKKYRAIATTLSASQVNSSFVVDSLISTKLLKINVTYDGVLKACILKLSFLECRSR